MKKLGLIKSHFSMGKSIITLEKPEGKLDYSPISAFDLIIQNKLDTLTLVDDNVSGLLQASKNAEDNKVKLIFGLRINIVQELIKDDNLDYKKAKYIIFAKNSKAYKNIISLWSYAAKDGFYYEPNLDWAALHKFWDENLILAVPFYDSFIHLNTLHNHVHVPEFKDIKPFFFAEENDLPFDDIILRNMEKYCAANNFDSLPAQSIYYKSSEDFLAYLTYRCIHNRGHGGKTPTLEAPNCDGMTSDTFSFDRWFSNI